MLYSKGRAVVASPLAFGRCFDRIYWCNWSKNKEGTASANLSCREFQNIKLVYSGLALVVELHGVSTKVVSNQSFGKTLPFIFWIFLLKHI